MPQRIQAPDGAIVEFPDGMSDAAISAVMAKEYPAPRTEPPASTLGPQRAGYQPISPPKPNGLVDSALSFGQGLVDNAMGGADAMLKRAVPLPAGVSFPSLLNAGMGAAGKVAEAIGAPQGTAAVAGQVANGYRPQTTAGEVARTAGQFAPAALAPGSALQRLANVVVPTATTELAGRGAKALGAPQGVQDAARALGGIAGGIAANVRVSGGRPNPQEGMRQAQEALNEAGIDVSTVSQATMGRIGDLVRRGMNPREAALQTVATEDLPVPVPLTRGQRSGDPGQQLSENLMLRGARGSGAARQMRGLVADQQAALRGNTEAIADQLAGPGANAPTRGAGGQAVSDRLNALYDQQNAAVGEAYQAARAAGPGGYLPREQAPIMAQGLREAVAEYDPVRVPAVSRELDRIDNLAGSGQVTVRDLFDARSRLTKLRASSDPIEGGAAAAATRALDSQIDNAVTGDLLKGDPQAVTAWRTAIAQRRDFGRLFQSGDLLEALTERSPRNGDMRALKVDPGDATNYILGRADLGFAGKQNLSRDLTRLRDVLGPDSAEWNAIRAEAFQRFASQGEGPIEFGARQFSGPKFQKGWQDFNRRNPGLAQVLFTPEERGTINRFSMIASRVTSPVKGGDNPSNTAVAGMRLLANLSFLKGLPFMKELSTQVEAQINLRQAANATSQDVGRAPLQAPSVSLNSSTIRGLNAPSGPEWRSPWQGRR